MKVPVNINLSNQAVIGHKTVLGFVLSGGCSNG